MGCEAIVTVEDAGREIVEGHVLLWGLIVGTYAASHLRTIVWIGMPGWASEILLLGPWSELSSFA